MRSHASFVPSFLVFIFCMPLSDVQPFRLYRSYQDGQRHMTGVNWSTGGGDMNFDELDFSNPFQRRLDPIAKKEISEAKEIRNARECSHGFCDEIDGYPEDAIKNVLNNTKKLKEYFRGEVSFNLNNRGAFDDEEDGKDKMCEVRSVIKYPRKARNTKNQDKLLINVDGHKQGIVFETCVEDSQKCKFSESFPAGYVSSCKQKYVKRILATFEDNQNASWDSFEVPSCCVCTIKRN